MGDLPMFAGTGKSAHFLGEKIENYTHRPQACLKWRLETSKFSKFFRGRAPDPPRTLKTQFLGYFSAGLLEIDMIPNFKIVPEDILGLGWGDRFSR